MHSPVTLEIATDRLRLAACTPQTAAAAVAGRQALAAALGVHVPDEWPPEMLADVLGMLADKLRERPYAVGWWAWHVIARAGVVGEKETLIGSAGSTPWGSDNLPYFGYGVLPAFEGRGLASEAAMALIQWVSAQPGITRVQSSTFERHYASRRILEKCGFRCTGQSPDDDKASEADRQGRGPLLAYMLETAGLKGGSFGGGG